jgi:solute carrier family 39 (zinc transporter), member 7
VQSSFLQQSFKILFPFTSPALNALMGTLYISGPPNFLLALVPSDIDPSSLTVLVAFAVGGLLGDTLFHLLPEIFLGEVPEGEVRAVLVEPNKNLLLGVAILVGFATFVAMDKGLRIATGGEGHSHDHSHGHANEDKAITSATTSKSEKGSVRKRKGEKFDKATAAIVKKEEPNPSVKLSAYLNIIADFTHNITDGLAMSSSFYASPTIGATTTLAVFCHEIPHEVGDFALLIQGGMSKRTAMALQFVTALGAVLGTIIGIAVQELGGNPASVVGAVGGNSGLWGTSLQWGDMLLPFTAGTFLYVGTVGVVPEMLETGPDRMKELRSMALQFAAMAAGAGIMLG